MAVRERISEQTYQEIALGDDDRTWELYDGRLVEKPAMSAKHNFQVSFLHGTLFNQLHWNEFQVRSNSTRLRHSPENAYVPDVLVLPAELFQAQASFETYSAPLPLVIEVWSPSTGGFDVGTKLANYQRRGDLEIWRIHPRERTLTAWRRQPEGAFEETVYHGGIVRPKFLPNLAIDPDALLAV